MTSPPVSAASRRRPRNALAFLALGTVAGAGFALLNRSVAHRDTAAVDRKVHRKARLPESHPVRRVAEGLHPLGKWWTYVPVSALVSLVLVVSKKQELTRDPRPDTRAAGAAAILGAALTAALMNQVLDDILPQPPAPPGRPSPNHPVFPSGHTFGTASASLSAAWVLTREGLAPAWVAFPVAVAWPLVSAGARMLEDKHWITDVAGGFLAALIFVSPPLAMYEGARHQQSTRSPAR